MVNLPSGTVTFVFTDIEGSTRLLTELRDAEYATLLAVHRRLVREIFAAHDGLEIDTQGDAFFYSFARARQAVAAAIELQRAHAKASWPGDVEVRVRAGLHTGEPVIGDEGYTGIDVVRAARIAALGGGGQVLLSDTTRAIAADDLPDGVALRAIGQRQLKDIERREELWALEIDGVPRPGNDELGAAPEPGVSEPSGGEPLRTAGERLRRTVDRARETIEARVLSELEEALPGALSRDLDMSASSPPNRSVSREIKRLHALREQGALTEEQYRRMIDRLLESDSER
jgi:class 3 adenylate cyclase